MFANVVKVLSNMALGTNIRLLQMEICSLMIAMADGRESTKGLGGKRQCEQVIISICEHTKFIV